MKIYKCFNCYMPLIISYLGQGEYREICPTCKRRAIYCDFGKVELA